MSNILYTSSCVFVAKQNTFAGALRQKQLMTRSLAAARIAPVAPSRLAMVYVNDPERAAAGPFLPILAWCRAVHAADPQATRAIGNRAHTSESAATRRSISSSLCCGVGVKRSRSLPRATVG